MNTQAISQMSHFVHDTPPIGLIVLIVIIVLGSNKT